MEQPKYRFEDFTLQSDKKYTDINEIVVGFLIDKDIILPYDIKNRLEAIVNDMLAVIFEQTHEPLYPTDFEVCLSLEMDTKTNEVSIRTTILGEGDLNLHGSVVKTKIRSFLNESVSD